MNSNDFFIKDLNGEKIWLSYNVIHQLRKDILLFYDDNIGETSFILMPESVYTLDYWKYLNINYEKEWAESEKYKNLIEEGCLVLIHGIILEILDQPISYIAKEWRNVDMKIILNYVENYNPKTNKLKDAKNHILKSLQFIKNMENNDLDSSGLLRSFDLSISGKWFEKEIIREYYRKKI